MALRVVQRLARSSQRGPNVNVSGRRMIQIAASGMSCNQSAMIQRPEVGKGTTSCAGGRNTRAGWVVIVVSREWRNEELKKSG